METSTLVVVFLLISAASLASYFLSHWSAVRGNVSWAATGIGAALLWAAAALILVLVAWMPARLLMERLGEQIFQSPADSRRESHNGASTPNPFARRSSVQANPPTERHSNPNLPDNSNAASPAPAQSRTPAKETSATAAPASKVEANTSQPRYNPLQPWGATNCVYALNLDPTVPDRWKIDNSCQAPVAILLASSNAGSIAWNYERGGMILPDRGSRPVTAEEETHYGEQISYVACIIETSTADDPCLERVRAISSHSSQPLETVLGDGTAVKRHGTR